MKQDLEKIAVVVRCTKSDCKFNGVVLTHKDKSNEESVKKGKCPLCHNMGCLQLVSF